MSGLEFCEAVHPALSEGSARTKLGYVDDFNVEGQISKVAQDVQRIVDTQANTGLVLNLHTFEITANKFDVIDQYSIFSQLKRLQKEDMTLLGSPVLPSKAMNRVL